MISHESKRKGTWKSDACRELLGKQIKHKDGESPGDKGDNAKVPLGFFEWIEKMGKDKKKGRVEKGGVFFIKS